MLPRRRFEAATLLVLGVFMAFGLEAQELPGTIRGSVTGAADGEPVRGVSVSVRGLGRSAISNQSGRYLLPRVPAGTQVITFQLLGYAQREDTVQVPENGDLVFDVTMISVPVTLGEVVVSAASRGPERIVEAPAAVAAVPPAAAAAAGVLGQPATALAGVPGVDIVQSGVNDVNVNTRGFNSSLNRRVLVLQDGRDLAIAFLGAPQEWNALAVPFDEHSRIELVRGPGSALYGANAFSGVLAITSPNARDIVGTRVAMAGGELDTWRADVRHAGFLSGRLGYRINAGYSRSDTWSRSRTAADSLDLVRQYAATSLGPHSRVREVRPLNGQTQGTFGLATGERDPLTSTYGAARLDYHTSGGGIATAEYGIARVENEVFVTGIGRVQVSKADRPFWRLNYDTPRFNIMGWYSGRKTIEPQYSLGAGIPLQEQSSIYHVEGQVNQQFGDRVHVVAGASFRSTAVNTDSTLMEAADDDRQDNSMAVFGQLEFRMNDWLRAVVASRFDDGSLYEGQFSPKAALVAQPHRDHSIRLTVNRAFQTPNYSEFFLRAPAGAPTASPRSLENSLEGYFAAVAGAPLPPSVTAGLNLGALPWDFDALTTVQARGNRDLRVETVVGWEIGYKGNLSRRTFVTLDLYRGHMRDFVTDLLPGVNPAFPTYALVDDRDVVEVLDSLNARLTALGLPATHPLRAPIPLLRGGYQALNGRVGPLLATLPDGRRALVVSYTNAGDVIEQGIEAGVSIGVGNGLTLDGSWTLFTFDVRSQALGDRLLPNTPRNKFTFGLTYADTKLDFNLTARLVDDMDWAAGVFAGHVPASQTINASAGYRITRQLRAHAVVTNLTDQRVYQLYGGSVVGRRALVGLAADF